ncbi:MAG: ATP-binding protein [Anaerolineales bacterium]
MKILTWTSLLDRRQKLILSILVLVMYGMIAAIAPFQVSFAVVVLGFLPIILISLLYGWRVGALFGLLIPLISMVAALLRADPLFDMGRRLIGVISGGILGAIIGLIRDQWMALKGDETAINQRVDEKTQALQKQNAYLLALHETTLALINHLELNDLLELILQRACLLNDTQHGFIDLVLPDQSALRQEFGAGNFAELNHVTTRKGQGITGRVWASGQYMVVDDYPTWEGHIPEYEKGSHAIVCYPLKSQGEVIGVIGVAYAEPERRFSEEQIAQLGQFARMASIALENARLYQTIQEQLRLREQAEEAVRTLNEDLERRVMERTAQLEYANRELQSFSYAISHDLRPPLRAIDGYSRIVLDEEKDRLTPESIELLKKVRLNAQRMDRLINDILNFTRLGRHSLRRAPVAVREDILQAFQQALEEFPDAENVHLTLGDLPETISADPALLHLIFTHLLSNAIKFSRHTATPHIEVGCGDMNGAPTFYVRDNGIGFDMKYAQKIFSVFERLHSGDDFEGTGAGLAIVQRAIQIHEGRIWVDSAPGKGATFYFTLGDIQPC